MKKKQTAVDWLVDFFEDYYALIPLDIIEKAKAMEKKQIINAYATAIMKENNSDYIGMNEEINGEQYYNETFAS
jgi:hypothetical protein